MKIVTQSYPVVGVDGKNVDVIIGGWKVSCVLPRWIKDSNCWNRFLDDYVAGKKLVQEEEEKEEEEEEDEEDDEEGEDDEEDEDEK